MAVKVGCTKLMFDRRVYAKAVQRRAKTCPCSKRLTRRGSRSICKITGRRLRPGSSLLREIPKVADKVGVVAVLYFQETIEGA